ncbi:uncharacterized protein DUF4846 [Mucilaginibacter gracilis]|uniref:Uncharacterized protein DUF4846 n=1 Tax=Mucilaginibacter gracilis TaxID=423350 RepID=A0A495IU30_9SPHI|nr:DUF4846 domain-containing protein [Mucilaginibacter gracilis]RKR80043.1 uncharacterized protein DUF4846 [Mucilaginibacter gracilis]
MKIHLLLAFYLFVSMQTADNVSTRFAIPAGYQRVNTQANSFAAYLQTLPLKAAGSHTKTYYGTIAATDAYTAAVVNLSLGKQDLQQCADAVMRLRGEYLYHQKKYDAISFKFTSGFKCDYLHYANGYRYRNDKWILRAKPDYGYANFLRYMDLVFAYAGTLSLEKELKKVNSVDELKVGDIFIHGGSPGHCFIVVDMAQNAAHKKIFLLAQSYMPAQDIQLLQNGSPWFSLDKPAGIPYQELIDMKYLRRFE